MSRELIRIHRSFQTKEMPPRLLCGIRRRFHRLSPWYGQIAHALRTLAPVAGIVLLRPAAPRLACVKPAASVHPEPGSNSSLYNLYNSQVGPCNFQFLKLKNQRFALLILIVLKSVLACTCSSYSFNELAVLSETGCKGMRIFLIRKIIFKNI